MLNMMKKKKDDQQGESKPAEEAKPRVLIDGLTEIEEAEAAKCKVAEATAKAAAATGSAVTAFNEVAEHLNKHGLDGPVEVTGEISEVASTVDTLIAEASVRASETQQAPIAEVLEEAAKEAESIQVELPASLEPVPPAVEAAKPPVADPALVAANAALKPVIEPTDDTRAPLDLTVKAKEEKPAKVKKPPFDWQGKVFKPLAAFTTKTLDAIGYGLKKTAEGMLFIAALIIMIVLNTPGGLLYAGGWLAKAGANAVKNGWNQKPLTFIDLNEVMAKHNDPIAPAVAS